MPVIPLSQAPLGADFTLFVQPFIILTLKKKNWSQAQTWHCLLKKYITEWTFWVITSTTLRNISPQMPSDLDTNLYLVVLQMSNCWAHLFVCNLICNLNTPNLENHMWFLRPLNAINCSHYGTFLWSSYLLMQWSLFLASRVHASFFSPVGLLSQGERHYLMLSANY